MVHTWNANQHDDGTVDHHTKTASRVPRLHPPAGNLSDGATATAEQHGGRWIALCPFDGCNGAEVVNFETGVFYCGSCGNAPVDHQPIRVAIPDGATPLVPVLRQDGTVPIAGAAPGIKTVTEDAALIGVRVWLVIGQRGGYRLASPLRRHFVWEPGAPAHADGPEGISAADPHMDGHRNLFPNARGQLAVIGHVRIWGDIRPLAGGEIQGTHAYPDTLDEVTPKTPGAHTILHELRHTYGLEQ